MLYPLHAVRTFALHCQHLTQLAPRPLTPEEIMPIIEDIGGLQIDTLQRVRRSHYIALWSRIGHYDPALLDSFLNDSPRRLFEYWLHAACLIPFSYYPYLRHKMELAYERQQPDGEGNKYVEPYRDLMGEVLGRVRAEGALRGADFEDPRAERGSWWDWKPAKHALEHLYNSGHLMVAGRVKFQRQYDLPERVIPPHIAPETVPPDEARRFWVELSMKALGIVFSPVQALDYVYMNRPIGKPIFQALLDEGVLVKIQAEQTFGSVADAFVHRDRLPLLQQAADGQLKADLTTFLTPFDSLFWASDWETQLWGFENRVEAYTPAPKRRWGYLSYPILYKDCLVGRFDPKLERREGVLRLEHLHLEPNVSLTDDLVQEIAEAMRRFMVFHEATELVIEPSDPFGEHLLAAWRA